VILDAPMYTRFDLKAPLLDDAFSREKSTKHSFSRRLDLRHSLFLNVTSLHIDPDSVFPRLILSKNRC
jgi:hypothetical protein